MKTTIDIADDLLKRAKQRAAREGKTLRQVVEEALRRQLATEPEARSFKYQPHNFRGKGLQQGIVEGDWEQLRDLIYRLG
jgi:Arc/MetJ family transcription regulator